MTGLSEPSPDMLAAHFAGLTPAQRIRKAGEVADQLERFLAAVEAQDLGIERAEEAQLRGAILALRAVGRR